MRAGLLPEGRGVVGINRESIFCVGNSPGTAIAERFLTESRPSRVAGLSHPGLLFAVLTAASSVSSSPLPPPPTSALVGIPVTLGCAGRSFENWFTQIRGESRDIVKLPLVGE